MAEYDSPDKALVEAFSQLVTQIAAIPPDDILRSDLGGNNFVYALRLRELYAIVATLGTGGLPESRLRTLNEDATQALKLLLQIRSLDRSNLINLGDPIRNLSDQTRQMYERAFDSLAPCIALFQVQAGGLESWKQNAMRSQEILNSVAAQGQTALDELMRKVEIAGKAAEMNALSSYATYFAKEAVSHKRAAWWWLVHVRAVCRDRRRCLLALDSIWRDPDPAERTDNRPERAVGGHQGGHPLDNVHRGRCLCACLPLTSPQLRGQRTPKERTPDVPDLRECARGGCPDKERSPTGSHEVYFLAATNRLHLVRTGKPVFSDP